MNDKNKQDVNLFEITPPQAKSILYAHGVIDIFNDDEELALLSEQNPDLKDAYEALHRIAFGCKNKGVDNYKQPHDGRDRKNL